MVVDTSALVSIHLREPEYRTFVDLIDEADEACCSVVAFVELVAVARNRMSADLADLFKLVATLGLQLIPVDQRQMTIAAEAMIAFGKGRHPAGLNFGDCFAYALAKARGEALLFKGDDFARTDIVPAWRPAR